MSSCILWTAHASGFKGFVFLWCLLWILWSHDLIPMFFLPCRQHLRNWTDTSWRISIPYMIVPLSIGWFPDCLIVHCAIKVIVWNPLLQKRRGRSTGFFSCWHRLLVCVLLTSSNSFASTMTSTAQGQKIEFCTPLMGACWNSSIRLVNICQMTDLHFSFGMLWTE